MSTTTFTCDHCGKERTQPTRFYNRVKHHFCGNSCHARWRNGAKGRALKERIRELEAEAKDANHCIVNLRGDRTLLINERDKWKGIAEGCSKETIDAKHENKALEQRNRKLRVLAWAGWTSCLLCLLWALWGHFGRHLPTTYPDTGELVVCWQGESRTPRIAYVDSLGDWRDADNGERLEVTKWSRP